MRRRRGNSAAAAMQVAEAQLSQAQIDLDRTTIRARLSGEIGLSQTSPGALVTASQAEPLAVIRTIDPVYVDVTQSAADLLRWRRGEGTDAPGTDRAVELILADRSVFDQKGTLTAAEPHVDPQTGVVTLRMEFANPQKLLAAGDVRVGANADADREERLPRADGRRGSRPPRPPDRLGRRPGQCGRRAAAHRPAGPRQCLGGQRRASAG